MPPVARKAAARKTAVPVKTVVAEFEFARETPGTFKLDESGPREDHISGAIYLKKGPLGATKPVRARITVEIFD